MPGGETIGIDIATNVVVVDTYNVKNYQGYVNPAQNAGIKKGDIIVNIDGKKINKIEDIKSELQKYNNGHNKPLNIIIKREGRLSTIKMYPVKTKDNVLSLGMYLRDNIMGIGTLTFVYDKVNFAALGHQIQDSNTNIELSQHGIIKKADITSIKKGSRGNPGEKRANFGKSEIGKINKNTMTGIYGKFENYTYPDKQKLKVATRNEVKIGDAKILTVIDGQKVQEFNIKIIQLEKQKTKDIKGIKIQITDQELLEKTGGIIQGMSGSPIIQNNKIVGAVTHVLIDDSTVGYGIYIEFMLEEMGLL